jgi:F0F1-type ATP synthase assembly protein I
MSDGEFPEPPSDEELDARLAAQKERLDAARRKYEANKGSSQLDPKTSRGLGIGLSAAYAIIGLPLVGAGLGWLLDRALGTAFFVVVGVVAGLVGGMWHAVQLSNRA